MLAMNHGLIVAIFFDICIIGAVLYFIHLLRKTLKQTTTPKPPATLSTPTTPASVSKEMMKHYFCRWCGKEFESVQGLVCPHCSKPQKPDKLPQSGGDSVADIFGGNNS